jgi:hypothetical protein
LLPVDAPVPVLELPDPNVGRVLTPDLIRKIRDAAKNTVTPTWLTRLPPMFGYTSGGSLKADQWRVVATLYAPLVLIQEWPTKDPKTAIYLELTTDLMSAIYACTSHIVSPQSIDLYETHILAYLTNLKAHFSCHGWVPNYHAALHIIELLEEYGPAYGWWTFPFERLIRELQNVPNNSRVGQSTTVS